MTVLITGASGFIGSHIVANLLSKGAQVRATVTDSSDPERVNHLLSLPVSDGGSLDIVEMDLLDAESVRKAVAGCESVIHTAAVVVLSLSGRRRRLSIRVWWEQGTYLMQ